MDNVENVLAVRELIKLEKDVAWVRVLCKDPGKKEKISKLAGGEDVLEDILGEVEKIGVSDFYTRFSGESKSRSAIRSFYVCYYMIKEMV